MNQYWINSMLVVGVLGTLVLVSGCSRSPYDLAPVTGTVTVDGKPADVIVVFFPEDTQLRSANGATNANGRFTMGTLKGGDGAVVGKHRVAISTKTPPPMRGGGSVLGADKKVNEKFVLPFPVKYCNPETSGIEVEVKKKGKNDFTFELPSR